MSVSLFLRAFLALTFALTITPAPSLYHSAIAAEGDSKEVPADSVLDQYEKARSKAAQQKIDEERAKTEFEATGRMYLPLPMRVFSKYMLDVYKESDERKAEAFDRALSALQMHYDRLPTTVKVESLEQYVGLRYRNAERYTFLDFEIAHLTEGRGTKLYQFNFVNDAVAEEVNQYHERQKEFAKEAFREALSDKGFSADRMVQFQMFSRMLMDTLIDLENPTKDQGGERRTFVALRKLSGQISSEYKKLTADAFEQVFSRIEAEIRGVGDRLAEDKERFNVESETLKGAGRMIQLLLGGIFREEKSEGIRNMISGMIDFPDGRNYKGEEDPVQRFKVLIRYSFPQIQKILQIVARMEGFGDKMARVFGSLESDGKAAPAEVIKDLMEQERVKMQEKGIRLVSFEAKALKAGTIAQIHKAKIEFVENGQLVQQDVVVRVIKPGILRAISRGEKIMKKVALEVDSDPFLNRIHWPRLGPEVEGLTEGIYADTDTKGASKRQMLGDRHYTHTYEREVVTERYFSVRVPLIGKEIGPAKKKKTIRIHYKVPKVYYASEANNDTDMRIQIMEFTPGKKLRKVSDMAPEVANTIAKGLVLRWLDTAFIRSGFFHSDLHEGNSMNKAVNPANLLLDAQRSKVLYESKDLIEMEVSILDFGMGGTIEMTQRTYFIGIALAAKMRDAKFMKDMFWRLRDVKETSITEDRLLLEIQEKMEEQRVVRQKIEELGLEKAKEQGFRLMQVQDWVVLATNAGVRLPRKFVGLSRGTGAIMVLSMNYALANGFGGMMKKLIIEKPSTAVRVMTNGLVPKAELVKSVGRKLRSMCVSGVSGK